MEEIARELSDDSLPEEDLIQEGYVGLMEGIRMIRTDDPDLMPVNPGQIVRDSIRAAMISALERNRAFLSSDEFLVSRVELLGKSIDRLTEELGSKPNIDEIACDMQITQDEVLEILKLTGADVSDEALTGKPAQ